MIYILLTILWLICAYLVLREFDKVGGATGTVGYRIFVVIHAPAIFLFLLGILILYGDEE